MTASYSTHLRRFLLLTCLGGLAHANSLQGVEALREEARITREFQFSSIPDAYLTRIVARITSTAYETLSTPVRVRTVRMSRPLAICLGTGALFVSTGLLSRLENDSQVAALLAPEIIEALAPVGVGFAKERGVTNDNVAAAGLRRAGFDVSQGPVAIERLRGLLAAEKQFSYGPLAEDRNLKRRGGQLRHALETLALEKKPGVRVPDDPDALRKIAHQLSLELAADFIDRHEHESFLPLMDRIERDYGADGNTICLRANYLRSLGTGQPAAVIDAFRQCVAAPDAPASNYRELALLYRTSGDAPAAIRNFDEYLKQAPEAVDAPIIKTYLEELRAKQK